MEKTLLITGGTGSLGNSLVRVLLEESSYKKIIVFSRDELKQHEMKNSLQHHPKFEKLRFFLGDIRDRERLDRAFKNVNFVIHAAALKQVDTGEYNPLEFVKTNVQGSINVMEAALDAGVEKVVALSTDKASSPINLYGATKLTSDKIFIASNNYAGAYPTRFSVVRYGNVMASRGSVIPIFKRLALDGKPIPVTDSRMTRFWISIEEATKFVLSGLSEMKGGELFVPKIPSFLITDLARAISPNSKIIEIGIRPGEKLHEEMISIEDSRRTLEYDDKYVILPDLDLRLRTETNRVADNFSYQSNLNSDWLKLEKLAELVR
jgi:UDP-N-acetylglucosamine 4,6-dehydratase